MPIVSSFALVAALMLAVVIGPQTRPWSWGPAMLALAVSNVAALPVFWRRGKFSADLGLLAFGALTAGWFAWRAWCSPVEDLGQADLLLLAGAVGTFVSIRAIAGHDRAERVLIWGIAMLLLANVGVAAKQIVEPSFMPVFRMRSAEKMVSGFFAHCNEAANYFIASSMLVGAAAVFGRHHPVTRICWGLIAVAGLAAVYFTHSRGGILGAAVGCGVFAAVGLMIGKRQGAKWFAPTVIAVPILGILITGFLLLGWQDAQEVRQTGTEVSHLMDNTIRLYLLGIALSCIATHPWTGGGSRSFSWECYRFWDKAEQGAGGSRPDLVHNELFQAATDYGLIGAGLLLGLIAALAIGAVIRVLFDESKTIGFTSIWKVGALAGLAGMLVQSCFSFVFHLMPGAILLGICLGSLSKNSNQEPNAKTAASRIILSFAAVLCTVALLSFGWKGTRVTNTLWSSYFSKQGIVSPESQIEALTEAISMWPLASFYQERASIRHTLATSLDSSSCHELMKQAVEDYQQASLRDPYDPTPVINRANLLSHLKKDSEAEDLFEKAIDLEGGLEPGFRAHYSLAIHLHRKGIRLAKGGEFESSLVALEHAAAEMEVAVQETPPWVLGHDGREIRVSIYENLGSTREALKNQSEALDAYELAASLPGGQRTHYLVAVLLGKKAVEAWSNRKPSEALKWFIEARKRVGQAGGQLPYGIAPEQRTEYIAYLDRNIAFLKGAKVQPEK